ncbi:MAG: hypothetical protein WC592_04075 [Candidatus Omnitrophota bacterium]|nr:hypothetical protein [Candidatus Omnitrophota bacterium]
MKKALLLAVFLIFTSISVFAGGPGCGSVKEDRVESREQMTMKPDTIFQKVGDFITGDYDVNGKPLKKVGILQATADEINKMKAGGR